MCIVDCNRWPKLFLFWLRTSRYTHRHVIDFIKDEYANCNIEYVLLGGDTPKIPVKYVDGSAYDSPENIAADQWYANLDSDNQLDLGEIAIGRACVENEKKLITSYLKHLDI